MNALLVGWQWLAVYPALVATGLICTSLGIGLTLLLFRIAGPRRTRLVSQIVATIIGAASYSPCRRCTFCRGHEAFPSSRLSRAPATASFSTSRDGCGCRSEPQRANHCPDPVVFDFHPDLCSHCAAARRAFRAERCSLRRYGRICFAETNKGPVRFRPGLGRALRLKEWRLLGRDPWLLSQIMLQVIYTLPVSIVIWRSQGPNGSMAISIAPAIVVIAAQISASLAWLTISSEDAPEFLATAPVSRRVIERRKLEAIAVPLSCFLAAPLLALAWASVELALYTFVFTAGAAASTAFLNFWHPMPGRRVAVLRRHSQSKLIAMLEHLLSLLWAVAMVLCVVDSWYALVPLGMIAGILWLNRPRNTVSTAHVARQAPA